MKVLLLVILLLMLAVSVSAQDCRNGLPCGPVPWRLPYLPALPSPTRFPTVVITAVPTATLTPTPTGTPPTATPVPSTTAQFEIGEVNDQINTLQAIFDGTPVATFDVGAFGEQELEENAGTFFGYALGLTEVHFGVFTPLLSFFLFSVVYIIGLRFTLLILPILSALFGVVRKIVSLILDFLPL